MPIVFKNSFSLLHSHGMIAVRGAEAAPFLHNLLSNDVRLQQGELQSASWSALCSAKGRMLATFLQTQHEQDILLRVDASLTTTMVKRLNLYVLRAQARVRDASTEFAQIGIMLDANTFQQTSLPHLEIMQSCMWQQGCLVRLFDVQLEQNAAPIQRWLWCGALEFTHACQQILQQHLTHDEQNDQQWRWLAMQAGVAEVNAQSSDQFVPQMLNWELTGGINFKKGCYPGQEIVARTHYLGKLKRRMVLAHADVQHVDVMQAIWSSSDTREPCGAVVNWAAHPHGGVTMLIEIKLAALAEQSALRLEASTDIDHVEKLSDAPIQILPLPYAVPELNSLTHSA